MLRTSSVIAPLVVELTDPPLQLPRHCAEGDRQVGQFPRSRRGHAVVHVTRRKGDGGAVEAPDRQPDGSGKGDAAASAAARRSTPGVMRRR